ncbi:unnamed protein product [Amoebophrya sp. A25]|nr:unnamed protein product [Amoebophrya sp. A25]|eukprot:GSA25T00016802001.1
MSRSIFFSVSESSIQHSFDFVLSRQGATHKGSCSSEVFLHRRSCCRSGCWSW